MTSPAQCGRTFPHLPHDTEEGHCAGLPGVRRAGPPPDPWEEGTGAGYDVRALRAGLAAILSHATVAEDHVTATIATAILGGDPLPVPPPGDIVTINVWRDHGDGHTTNLGRVSGITSLTYSDCARYACPEVPTREALTALLRDLDAPPSDTEPADPSVPVIITGGEGTVTVITPELHEGRTIVILPGDTVVNYDGEPLVTQQDPA